MKIQRLLQVLGVIATMAIPVVAFAEGKIPQTAEDHLALAKQYQNKAASYRQEARYHREMAETYRRNAAPAGKGQSENPWARKMARHCKLLIDEAEKMADDSEKAAQYHTLRARELSGS